VKLLQNCLMHIDEALTAYQVRTNLMFGARARQRLSMRLHSPGGAAVATDSGDDDEDSVSRGSTSSGYKGARRGSDCSLVNISLGGDTAEYVLDRYHALELFASTTLWLMFRDMISSNALISELNYSSISPDRKRPACDDDCEEEGGSAAEKVKSASSPLHHSKPQLLTSSANNFVQSSIVKVLFIGIPRIS
jgi:hypothetical protein